MPTEIASFTPNQITGTAKFLDLWNADLWWGAGNVSLIASDNQVQFRTDPTTWKDGYNTGETNGIVQATFNMPSSGYFLGVFLLSTSPSSGNSHITLKINTTHMGNYEITGEGIEIPIVAELSKGEHRVTLLQMKNVEFHSLFNVEVDPGEDLWFHSLTCFEV